MSQIILRWLRDDVGLGQALSSDSDLERECANGVLLGSVLAHYGLQPDIDKFVKKSDPQSSLGNFQRLEPSMLSLNVKFTSKMCNQLLTEDKGVALKLLTELKLKLDASKTKSSARRLKLSTTAAASSSLETRTTRTKGIAPAPNHVVLGDQAHEALSLTKSAKPKEFRMQSLLMKQFVDESISQQRSIDEHEEHQRHEREKRLAELRKTHLKKLEENRTYLKVPPMLFMTSTPITGTHAPLSSTNPRLLSQQPQVPPTPADLTRQCRAAGVAAGGRAKPHGEPEDEGGAAAARPAARARATGEGASHRGPRESRGRRRGHQRRRRLRGVPPTNSGAQPADPKPQVAVVLQTNDILPT